MPRASYPPQLRRQLVELVRSGRSVESLAEEFGLSAQTIRKWVQQSDADEDGRSDLLTTVEEDDLQRQRREDRALRRERKILKKAATWFARETDSLPKKGPDS